MKFIVYGHNFDYEVQTISQVFYPNEKFEKVDFECWKNSIDGEIIIESHIKEGICRAIVYKNQKVLGTSESSISTYNLKEQKEILKFTLYDVLSDITGFKPSWGALTGIRPSKLVLEYYRNGYEKEEVFDELANKFHVNFTKIQLAIDVADVSDRILKNNKKDGFDLYIGIPFCPTRCLYCSFTSYPVDKYSNYMDKYLNCLFKEMDIVEKYNHEHFLESIYIGGGTPTALDEKSLERLLYEINTRFDISKLKEFTVEAGRPDTLSIEKLEIMKKYNVGRISINPQTLNDKTLEKIGRKHSAQMFFDAFQNARNIGFDNINVDLILGLPNETEKEVDYTFKEISKLKPENITVHTLTIKRGSTLKENIDRAENINKTEYKDLLKNVYDIENMIEISKKYMKEIGMKPYYMYRQKNTIGNFENVGYCKEGFECLYNIQIMEEQQTILAIGANASSKFFFSNENKLERVFNVKSLEDYIDRIDEMIERKNTMILSQ